MKIPDQNEPPDIHETMVPLSAAPIQPVTPSPQQIDIREFLIHPPTEESSALFACLPQDVVVHIWMFTGLNQSEVHRMIKQSYKVFLIFFYFLSICRQFVKTGFYLQAI